MRHNEASSFVPSLFCFCHTEQIGRGVYCVADLLLRGHGAPGLSCLHNLQTFLLLFWVSCKLPLVLDLESHYRPAKYWCFGFEASSIYQPKAAIFDNLGNTQCQYSTSWEWDTTINHLTNRTGKSLGTVCVKRHCWISWMEHFCVL